MTSTDQINILDRKIKQNKAQYNIDRKAAKISAFSSDNLDKYRYLTCEDLGYKISVIEQARFEYSPLGKIFNKRLREEDKKEGLLKRLRIIEVKNEEQLKAIEDQRKKQLDAIKNIKTDWKSLETSFFSELSPEANKIVRWAKKEKKNTIDSEILVCVKIDRTIFNFSIFKNSLEFASNIYHEGKTSFKDASISQYRIFSLLNDLKEFNLKKLDKIKSKEEILIYAETLYNNRNIVIKTFKDGVFLFNSGFQKKKRLRYVWYNTTRLGKSKQKRFDRIKNKI